MLRFPKPLATASWLNEHLHDSDLIVLDASIKKVTAPEKEQNQIRIPNARFFDLTYVFSDPESEFPNTWPSTEHFQKEARNLGINNDSKIVVYDDKGIYSSARAWYMFKAFGHEDVAVLDGGLPVWIENGYPTEEITEESYPKGDFSVNFSPEKVRFFEEVKENVERKDSLILDARSADRFYSRVPEPREGLRRGNIPGSFSLPHSDIQQGNSMKTPEELKAIFYNFNKGKKPMIFSCGSGVTACVLALGAELAEEKDYSIYDGSWTEWGTLVKE